MKLVPEAKQARRREAEMYRNETSMRLEALDKRLTRLENVQ